MVLKYREKYRYLKFVERTKVLRRIKKLEKRLSVIDGTGAAGEAAVAVKEDSDADSDDDNADDGDDMDEEKEQKLRAELESFKLNLLYIEHFPGDMKYISLFPKSASAGGGEDDNESVSSDDDDEQEEEEEEKQDTTTTNSSKNHQKWSTSNKPLIWQAKIKANISEAITTGAIKQHGFSIRKRDIFGSSSSSNNVATKLDVGKAKHNKRSVAAVDQEISLEQHQTLSNQKGKGKEGREGVSEICVLCGDHQGQSQLIYYFFIDEFFL